VHKRYGANDFELLAIALERDKAQWLKKLVEFDMPWTQLIDISGSFGDAVELYNLITFPYIVLLDRDGTIIERGISVKQLKEKLDSLIK